MKKICLICLLIVMFLGCATDQKYIVDVYIPTEQKDVFLHKSLEYYPYDSFDEKRDYEELGRQYPIDTKFYHVTRKSSFIVSKKTTQNDNDRKYIR